MRGEIGEQETLPHRVLSLHKNPTRPPPQVNSFRIILFVFCLFHLNVSSFKLNAIREKSIWPDTKFQIQYEIPNAILYYTVNRRQPPRVMLARSAIRYLTHFALFFLKQKKNIIFRIFVIGDLIGKYFT